VSELITANDVLSIASVTFLTSRPSCVPIKSKQDQAAGAGHFYGLNYVRSRCLESHQMEM